MRTSYKRIMKKKKSLSVFEVLMPLMSVYVFSLWLIAEDSIPKVMVRKISGQGFDTLQKWQVPDFGADGLLGLDESQKRDLLEGKVVILKHQKTGQSSQTIIQAALLFDLEAEKVWGILSATERQAEYLDDIISVELLEKKPEYNRMQFVVTFLGKKVCYTVIHHFVPEQKYFWWELDRQAKNDLKELFGFWRLYPFDSGKTLARYGSVVIPSFPVPGFLRNWLYREKVEDSLVKVKSYVEKFRR